MKVWYVAKTCLCLINVGLAGGAKAETYVCDVKAGRFHKEKIPLTGLMELTGSLTFLKGRSSPPFEPGAGVRFGSEDDRAGETGFWIYIDPAHSGKITLGTRLYNQPGVTPFAMTTRSAPVVYRITMQSDGRYLLEAGNKKQILEELGPKPTHILLGCNSGKFQIDWQIKSLGTLMTPEG